jgi:hypothetical protein
MLPRVAFCPVLTAAGDEGVAIGAIVAVTAGIALAAGAIVAVAIGIALATGAIVAVDPVFGITGAAVLTGMAVATGVAAAHADRTNITMSREENNILFFIMIFL